MLEQNKRLFYNRPKLADNHTSAATKSKIYSASVYDEKYSRTDGCIAINAVLVTIDTEVNISNA